MIWIPVALVYFKSPLILVKSPIMAPKYHHLGDSHKAKWKCWVVGDKGLEASVWRYCFKCNPTTFNCYTLSRIWMLSYLGIVGKMFIVSKPQLSPLQTRQVSCIVVALREVSTLFYRKPTWEVVRWINALRMQTKIVMSNIPNGLGSNWHSV